MVRMCTNQLSSKKIMRDFHIISLYHKKGKVSLCYTQILMQKKKELFDSLSLFFPLPREIILNSGFEKNTCIYY